MATIRLHVIDYDKLGLTWNIDVYYKRKKIATLTRNEFEELTGLLAISTKILKAKYNINFSPVGCKQNVPFEINCHTYNAEKLSSLEYLLKQEFEENLDQEILTTEKCEKNFLVKFIEYSSQQQVDDYLNSLNEDNTLVFKLQELGLEKIIDLKFIKNIELIHERRIQNLLKRKEESPELYEDPDGVSSQELKIAIAFMPKFEMMMKKIEKLKS